MQQFKNFAQNMQNLGHDFCLMVLTNGFPTPKKRLPSSFWGYTSVSILMDQFQLLRHDIIVQFTVRIYKHIIPKNI